MNPNQQNDIKIRKTLSWLLRHAALKEGISINDKGYVRIDDILKHPKFASSCTFSDILQIVKENDKQRFTVHLDVNQVWWIKANQGHSLQVQELELEEICLTPDIARKYPEVIHGTYFKSWSNIKTQGLHRMQRNHIHFACGLPGGQGVISGMRRSCQIYIYIDIQSALENGVKFFRSLNGVVLSPGDSDGFIRPQYFLRVVDAKTGKQIQ